MRDGLSSKQIKKLFAPAAAVTDNTAQVSSIIDTQGYDMATLAFIVGTLSDADATFTVLLEEDDDSGFGTGTAVADDDMVSQTPGTAPETAAAFQFDDDGEVRSIGYVGSKRYIRLTITPANNTGNLFLGGIAILEGRAPGVAVATKAAS